MHSSRTALLARPLAVLATLGLGASFASAQVNLINDNFTNATRVGTAPSAQGIDRDGGTTRDYIISTNGNQAMAVGTGNDYAPNIATGINGNSIRVINNFSAYQLITTFASTTLNAGDSLSVTFNVRTSVANVASGGAGAFRIGLFNNGGTVQTNNVGSFGGFPSTTFDNDQGYIANYSTNASGFVTVQTQERSAGSNQSPFAGTTASVGAAGTAGTTAIAFDTNHAVSFTLTRSLDGNSVSLTSSFNGASANQSDSTTPYTTFNQLGIFFGSGWGNATTPRDNFIDDVLVTYTAAPVPEPSAFAALAGLGALGFAASRRRARR